MTTRQRQKRQDETRQPAQTPVADAIVLGTAAGGLVLGTMQAQGAVPQSHEGILTRPGVEIGAQDVAMTPAEAASSDSAETSTVETTTAIAPDVTQNVAVPNPASMAIEEQLVQDLSQQMAGTISKVMQGAEPGMSAADFSQSISSDIVQSAQEIVARLDIGALLTETSGLGKDVLAEINPAAMVDDILGGTSDLATTVLSEVASLPAEILGGTVGALAELPSALLGNEGPDGSGGFLSEIFYADGSSDGLSIPDLSTAASSLVSDIGESAGGLLGLSYVDVSDPQGGHGLNALSLL
ncbi:MAG: hypothetical protein EOP20_03385 [Hyphomicrobiales bacterium]|nr:MAG: hypothetical protein EOP20_03385 [Hyphomicrobiales bacterium]